MVDGVHIKRFRLDLYTSIYGRRVFNKDKQRIINITHEEGLWHKKELTKTILYQLIIALTKLIKDFFSSVPKSYF